MLNVCALFPRYPHQFILLGMECSVVTSYRCHVVGLLRNIVISLKSYYMAPLVGSHFASHAW